MDVVAIMDYVNVLGRYDIEGIPILVDSILAHVQDRRPSRSSLVHRTEVSRLHPVVHLLQTACSAMQDGPSHIGNLVLSNRPIGIDQA